MYGKGNRVKAAASWRMSESEEDSLEVFFWCLNAINSSLEGGPSVITQVQVQVHEAAWRAHRLTGSPLSATLLSTNHFLEIYSVRDYT